MPLPQKTLIRAALRLHERLRQFRTRSPDVILPISAWDQCRRLARKEQRAHARGWDQAALFLRDSLVIAVRSLQMDVDRLCTFADRPESGALLSPGEIFRELRALEREFDDVTCDLKAETLSVTTEPIVLDDYGFGAFEIKLCWGRLDKHDCYEVIAVEPNYPGSRSD